VKINKVSFFMNLRPLFAASNLKNLELNVVDTMTKEELFKIKDQELLRCRRSWRRFVRMRSV